MQLGDAYGEENRRMVFELHIPQLAALGVVKVADVIVRYVSVGDEIASHEVTIPLQINLVSADEAAAQGPDGEVTEEVLILRAAQAQRQARKLADDGDYQGAQGTLRTIAEELRKQAPSSNRAGELLREAQLLEQSEALADERSWDASSSKALHYDANRKGQGRRRSHRPPKDQL